MTFYSILFGVLFIGTMKEFAQSVLTGDALKIILSVNLALIIFNDVLYTAHFISDRDGIYTVKMKILDLLNFFILGTAIVCISPNRNIFLAEADVAGLPSSVAPIYIWLLIAAYWGSALMWNFLAERAMKKAGVRRFRMEWLVAMCSLVGLVGAVPGFRPVQIATGILYALFLLFYVIVYKAIGEDRLEQESSQDKSASSAPDGRAAE